MRILLVTHFYPAHGGGVEIVAAHLARHMVAAGHDLVWCASDVDDAPSLTGVRVMQMRTSNVVERTSGMPYPLWGLRSLLRLGGLVRSADAVHVHDCIYIGSLVAAWMAHRHGKPLIVTQHIGPKPLPLLPRTLLAMAYRLGAWIVLARAANVAFISPVGRRHFEQITGPLPHYRHVPNGVDHGLFAMVTVQPSRLRADLGFDPALPLMLFVGRFVPTKRLPLLRQMAKATPHWQWCVIGEGPVQPADWELSNVRVLPFMSQTDLAGYYRAADLLVLPSEGEGFPLVVQEAMACGLPACITATVAAGGSMPTSLWLELPEVRGESDQGGVAAIQSWLEGPLHQRVAQREACARHARSCWDWAAAARSHLSGLKLAP
jgi:glycosyltransferase involved in cell wall biosynthesis